MGEKLDSVFDIVSSDKQLDEATLKEIEKDADLFITRLKNGEFYRMEEPSIICSNRSNNFGNLQGKIGDHGVQTPKKGINSVFDIMGK